MYMVIKMALFLVLEKQIVFLFSAGLIFLGCLNL